MTNNLRTIIVLLISFSCCIVYAQSSNNNSFDGKKLLGKNKDDADRVILKEEDFR